MRSRHIETQIQFMALKSKVDYFVREQVALRDKAGNTGRRSAMVFREREESKGNEKSGSFLLWEV